MFNLKQRMNDHEITMIDIRENTTQILASLQTQNRFDHHNIKQHDRSREFNVFVDFQSSRNDFIDTSKENRFQTIDVEYFDLYLLYSYNKNDVIISREKTIYRDVYFFIDAIKNITKLMKYHLTRIRLHRCLCDIV